MPTDAHQSIQSSISTGTGFNRTRNATGSDTLANSQCLAPSPFFLILAIWLVAFATFSMPERAAPISALGLDSLALVKVGIRGIFLVLIGWAIIGYLRLESTRQIVAIYVPLALFIGWAFLSTFWSPMKAVSIGQALGQLLLLGISVNVALSCKNAAYESKILFHLCLMLLALSSVAIGLHTLFPDWGSLSRDRDFGVYHPTNIASAASIGLLLVLACGLSLKQRWAPSLLVIGLFIHVVALILASNRTALILDVPICAGLILFYGNRVMIASATLAVCLVVGLFLVFDPGLSSINAYFSDGTNYLSRGQTTAQLSALSGRQEMWTAIWDSYLESPILGHGFFVSSSGGELFVWHSLSNHTAHNMLLQALVSTGVVGLVLILWWGFRLLRLSLSPGIGIDRRYYSIFIPVGLWFLVWSLLIAAFLGPIRPESVSYAVIVGLFTSRIMQARNEKSGQDLPG